MFLKASLDQLSVDRAKLANSFAAQDLMNNTSSYGPLRQKEGAPPPDEQLFIQPHLAQAFLERALYSNESALGGLKINHELPKNIQLKEGSTLKDLLKVGVDDHTQSWRVWQAFWRELTEPGTNPRPRVLLAADSVDHWMGPSKYFDAEHKVIHSQQFVLIRTRILSRRQARFSPNLTPPATPPYRPSPATAPNRSSTPS